MVWFVAYTLELWPGLDSYDFDMLSSNAGTCLHEAVIELFAPMTCQNCLRQGLTSSAFVCTDCQHFHTHRHASMKLFTCSLRVHWKHSIWIAMQEHFNSSLNLWCKVLRSRWFCVLLTLWSFGQELNLVTLTCFQPRLAGTSLMYNCWGKPCCLLPEPQYHKQQLIVFCFCVVW